MAEATEKKTETTTIQADSVSDEGRKILRLSGIEVVEEKAESSNDDASADVEPTEAATESDADVDEVSENGQQESDADAGSDADKKTDKPNKKKDAKARIEQLLDQRKEARVEAEQKAQRIAELEARLAALEKGEVATKKDLQESANDEISLPEKPDPYDFEKYPQGQFSKEYERDTLEWLRKSAIAELRAETEKAQRAQAATSKQVETEQKIQAHLVKGAEKYEDFEQKVLQNTDKWALPGDAAELIADSEVAHEILYHLANNPAQSFEIARLSPVQRAREIGKLEAKFSSAGDARPEKKITKAPVPPPKANQGGSVKSTGLSNDKSDAEIQRALAKRLAERRA